MPALAAIEPPNVRVQSLERKQAIAEPKKRVKGSSLCYTPPTMINDKKRDRSYFRRGLLGEGGFARCFEVTDFSGTRLAAKCIAKKSITSEKIKMKLLGEIKVHKSLDHPNIVRQRDCFEDEINVYMILDICTNGTLMDMLRARKKFTEPEVRFFGLQILGAVKYMHSKRVIHRDLKLGNLFLDDKMCIKVGDFGLAALLVDDNDRKKTLCGTPNYIAPEVLFSAPEGHSYEVDLWSIGVIFYAMLIGKPPFQSKDVKVIYAKIKSNEYEFPQYSEISEHARNLITSLLSTDPDTRPNIDDIAKHPFFHSGIMPRSIPASATKDEPSWPGAQAISVFRRHHNFVSLNAGIGQYQTAGKEPGKIVDVVIERPENGRYLPVSLSPRTGPTAKMINLKTERAGGVSDTLADRFRNAHLHEPNNVELSKPRHERTSSDGTNGIARRTTLGTGALRPQPSETQQHGQPESNHIGSLPRLRGARRRENPGPPEVLAPQIPSRLGCAIRMPDQPIRQITRSSRFGHLPIVEDVPKEQAHRGTKSEKPILDTPPSTLGLPEARKSSEMLTRSRETSADPSPRPASLVNRKASCNANEAAIDVRPPVRSATRARRHVTAASQTAVKIESNVISPAGLEPGKDMWSDITHLAELIVKLLGEVRYRPQTTRDETGSENCVLHISKWVDYSHRYGLGYQLSDQSTGVYFNDATSIILGKHASTIDFILATSERKTFSLDGPPKELEKKVYLLKHFKGYMTNHLNNAASDEKTSSDIASTRGKSAIYMTHYWRTTDGILFRLSDGTLQFNFTDHSKLVISMSTQPQETLIRYIDLEKSVTTSLLTRASQLTECRPKLAQLAGLLHDFVRAEAPRSA